MDEVAFPCAKLGHEMYYKHPLCATVMNASNDVCVEYFLQGKLPFLSIYSTVRYMIDYYECSVTGMDYCLQTVKDVDATVRLHTKNYLEQLIDR